MQIRANHQEQDTISKIVAAAEQFSDTTISNYNFDSQRLRSELLAVKKLSNSQMDEDSIRENFQVLDDLIFDFLPNLVTNLTNKFTEMISMGLVARDLNRNAPDINQTLEKFEGFALDALEEGAKSAALVMGGRTVKLHDRKAVPNGLDTMYKRVREGKFKLFYPFPNLDRYDPKQALNYFSKFRKAFTDLPDFSDKKLNTYLQALIQPIYASSKIESRSLRNDFFRVFQETTKSIADIYKFIGDIQSQLPDKEELPKSAFQISKPSPRQRFNNILSSNLIPSMKINGAFVFRMVANPKKFDIENN